MTLRIFVTGGTFDKEYNELNGELFFKNTNLREMLSLGRCGIDVDVRTIIMVDSTSITDDDRELIAHHVKRSDEERILVTHGTDTITQTAGVIAKYINGKTVVLTGAIVPYTFGSSDGLFNLGSAMAYAQVMPPGVYIAMNGRCFQWDKVRKNRKTGVFEDIGEPEG